MAHDPQALRADDSVMGTPRASRRGRVSLRVQLNVTLLVTMLGCIAALGWLRLDATRASVREEIIGANRVATQLLERVTWIFSRGGPYAMLEFLEQLGRVRANEITFVAADGTALYRSPPSTYKQGRSAPDWFTALVAPPVQRHTIRIPGAELTIESNASRAILDGWDELVQLAVTAALALVLLSATVFWVVGRMLRPFAQIEEVLRRMQRGDYAVRLPPLPGREAALIGEAVNQLGAAIEAMMQQRLAAAIAEQRLAESRDWSRLLEQQLEAERREIAAELHDELGQSVTGIRSLARSLASRLPQEDTLSRDTVDLIDAEAARLYDAMHGLIPRLTPMSLDPLGLADALRDLLASYRRRHPDVTFALEVEGSDGPVDSAPALAAYRTVQEGVNNALKHSGGKIVSLHLRRDETHLHLCITDDGRGLTPLADRPARFGLASLRARIEALGGCFEVGPAIGGGTRVQASLPLRMPGGSK
jgi:two-component system sensor histidine kinase UhpB